MDYRWSYIPIAVLIALYSGGFIGFGFLGLVKKRPLIFSGRFLMRGSLVVYVALLLFYGIPLFDPEERRNMIQTSLRVVVVLGYSLLIFLGYWQVREGYVLWGITRASFYPALLHALNQLHLAFDGPTNKLQLTETRMEVLTRVVDRTGAARLWVKQRPTPPVLREIVLEIDAYYAMTPVKVNYTFYIIALAAGILGLLALLGGFVYAWLMYNRLY